MNYLTAIILYLLTIFSFLQHWQLVFIVTLVLYSFRYGAIALIPAAIVLDGYFGFFYSVPILSMSAIVWYMGVEFIRPKVTSVAS